MSTFYQLIWKEIRGQGWRFVTYFSVISLAGLVSIAPPKFYGFFAENVDAFQTMAKTSATLFLKQLIVFGAVLAITQFFCNFIRAVIEEWISLRIEASLRCRFMSYMQRMPLESFDESQRGDWLTRMSQDIRSVEQFIALRLPQQIFDLVVAVGISILFLTQNFWIAVLLLSSAAIIAIGNFFIQVRITPMLENLRDLHGQVFQGLLENFEGLRSIRSYRAESFVLRIFTARVHSIIEKGLKMIRVVGLLIGSNSFIVNILTTGALTLVAIKLRQKELLLSDVFLYPFYIGMFYTSVFALVRGVFDWNDFFVHARRLDEVFMAGSPESYEQDTVFTAAFDRLEIKQSTVGYQGFAKLTKPFDFAVSLGETVVIRGHSGCGKSTFLEALAGLRYIDAESVTLSLAGQTVSGFGTSREGRVCLTVDLASYVEQRPYLLEGSLRNNLALDTKETDETLWAALANVNLEAFFREHGGLDFFINDNGRNLSEGQKQRIGLARSLIHLRPLILFDEPFASLDQESIGVLCKALNTLKATHGIVIVTHIIPEDLAFDRIVEFDTFCEPAASKERTLGLGNYPDGELKPGLLTDELSASFVDCRVSV